jgi:ParB family transcriptional regulator, chromosome partitioning protein
VPSSKKAGLGRGLAELLGQGATRVPGPARAGAAAADESAARASAIGGVGIRQSGIIDLPVDVIRANPRQPRRSIDVEGLEELARSIAAVGVVQPVIVRPVGDGYELIAGERRWRAAQLAGYTFVPVIVREASDTESLELALVENVVRQDLNPIDEAYALQVLLEDLGVTQEALADRVGKSRSAIANKVRLLDLAGPAQELVAAGSLTEGHGRAILGLKARGDQARLARRAAERGWSVRAVEKEVRRLNLAPAEAGAIPAGVLTPGMVESVREGIYGLFEVMPTVRLKGDGGRIEIPFRDQAELHRLLKRLERE